MCMRMCIHVYMYIHIVYNTPENEVLNFKSPMLSALGAACLRLMRLATPKRREPLNHLNLCPLK